MTARLITVADGTDGLFSADDLFNLCWGLNYQALYQYNRSPWVEHGYADPIESVLLLPPGVIPPHDAWVLELLRTSDQPGALGYHEDHAFSKHSASGPKKSSGRSSRGLALHPATSEEIPLAKVFCATSLEDGVAPSEVASHEMLEMIVDPQVVQESEIRKYLNTSTHQWYIAEVGDPVQGRGYDVGAPEKRDTGVIVADLAYPGWWGQEQTRIFTSAAEEFGLSPRVDPFVIAPDGYMSVAPEDEPSNWSQIYGSAHR